MLILNKEKENLLVEKFGFEKDYTIDKNLFYRYGKCLTIYSYNHPFNGKLQLYSCGKMYQDIIYDLIKEDVLIKIPNEDKQAKINKLKKKIEEMQNKLKEMEEN